MIFYKTVSANFFDKNRVIDYSKIENGYIINHPTYVTECLFEAAAWGHIFIENENYIMITVDNVKKRIFNSSIQLLSKTIIVDIKILTSNDILAILLSEKDNPNIDWPAIFSRVTLKKIVLDNIDKFTNPQSQEMFDRYIIQENGKG